MIDSHGPRCPRYPTPETSLCDCLVLPRFHSDEMSLRFRMLADWRMYAYYASSVTPPGWFFHVSAL